MNEKIKQNPKWLLVDLRTGQTHFYYEKHAPVHEKKCYKMYKLVETEFFTETRPVFNL
jgi:hypothetical protein